MDGEKIYAFLGKILLTLFFLAIVGGGGFYLGMQYEAMQKSQKQSSNAQMTPTVGPSINPTISSVTVSPTTASKKTLTAGVASGLSFSLYTIEFSSDWVVSHEHQDTEVPLDRLTLTRSGYELSIYQAATGGAMCLYPGDKQPEGPSSQFISYIEFTGAGGETYRRSELSDLSSGKKAHTICQKSQDTFGQPTSYGHISYKVPINFTPSILNEMDSIVASLKKK